MSSKYLRIVERQKKKAKKRVRIPRTIEDYMTNLTIDLKGVQNILVKMDTARWNIYQAWDSIKQIIRILRRKELLGKYEDWKDIICDDCKYTKRMLENLAILELESIITDGEDEKMISFTYEDWKEFIGGLEEKVNQEVKNERIKRTS